MSSFFSLSPSTTCSSFATSSSRTKFRDLVGLAMEELGMEEEEGLRGVEKRGGRGFGFGNENKRWSTLHMDKISCGGG